MSHTALNEAETRAELIDPALRAAGWGVVDASRVRREVIAPGRLQGGGRRAPADIADYVLTYKGQKLAVIEAKLGRYDDAIRYLGVAASLEPRNANHLYNMAVIADRAADREQAIKFYEEALEVDTLYGAGKSIPRENVFQRLAELR